MRIIPAIDIIGGKCVRLSQGEYESKKIYNENPLEVARWFEDNGIRYLHLVDLDGAKAKHVVNLKVLNSIASNTSLIVDFGGGIKSDDDIRKVFENGATQITTGSVAVSDPGMVKKWIEEYGNDKIILGADVKNGMVAVAGWQQISDRSLSNFLNDYSHEGVKYVVCTDISKDGMLQGTSLELYKALRNEFPGLKLVASGGVTHISELKELAEIGMDGVIIGKAIYEGNINLNDLKIFL
ncbi:MAG: 1-(5-phosphoribosyl)-5-[(5-phosphoribosylamino)methylideneamino]imidazole-4-carboxamide isomerase [Bacteroidales bacterium]|nr:1-(5-phosphoribosyl)-5-[(5-phosphoribosylamino)methylideneamino]imidazole-4-carboxamide isomerase [Bacteroidales bacterium]